MDVSQWTAMDGDNNNNKSTVTMAMAATAAKECHLASLGICDYKQPPHSETHKITHTHTNTCIHSFVGKHVLIQILSNSMHVELQIRNEFGYSLFCWVCRGEIFRRLVLLIVFILKISCAYLIYYTYMYI